MKYNTMLRKAALFGSVGAALLATSAQAQFNPARGNMLLGAREVNTTIIDGTPTPVRGAFDIMVDLGAYTRFNSGTAPLLLGGSSSPSEAYQGVNAFNELRFASADVTATFGNLDNVFMSAFAVNSGVSATANASWFLTQARSDVNVQSAPWARASAQTQGGTGNTMETVRNNAITSGTDINNTSTREGTGVSAAYGNSAISPFTGYPSMEASTGSGFSGASLVRFDLFDVRQAAGGQIGTPSDYLGYFEYQADGDLWFVPENFVPVPEASTYGLVSAAGLLLVALRRQMRAKTA